MIRHVFDGSDGTYGYRRVAAELARGGVQAGLELVRALMRKLGLVACQPRPWRPTTTLDMAFRNHEIGEGAVFHSDRGCQYTSQQFATRTSEHAVRRSMGRTGVCFDCETVVRRPGWSDLCYDWPMCLGVDLSAVWGDAPKVARPSGQ